MIGGNFLEKNRSFSRRKKPGSDFRAFSRSLTSGGASSGVANTDGRIPFVQK
jgi:hypothetical protein